jgi:hypothetical protein
MTAPDPNDQMAFIIAIHKLKPEVFCDLRGIVEQTNSDAAAKSWLALYPNAPAVRSTRDLAVQLIARDNVTAWLNRWHLNLPGMEWLQRAAELYVRDGWAQEFPFLAEYVPTHDQVVSLAWEPAMSDETRGAFVKRAALAVKIYADKVEAWQREQGFAPKQRDREAGASRWDLLARRIVLGETFDRIATRMGAEKQAAASIVRSLASRLGVTLPSGRQSRSNYGPLP